MIDDGGDDGGDGGGDGGDVPLGSGLPWFHLR